MFIRASISQFVCVCVYTYILYFVINFDLGLLEPVKTLEREDYSRNFCCYSNG